MTFEYRDAHGRILSAVPDTDLDDKPGIALWSRGEYGVSVPVRVPLDRVEEAVAGIRDAARQAAGQPTQHRIPRGPCGAPWSDSHGQPGDPCPAAGQTTTTEGEGQCGQWGGCVLPADHPGAHRHRPRPAVEQPAEAQLADKACVEAQEARYALMHLIGDYSDETIELIDEYRAAILREAADAEAEAERQMAAVERVRHVLEMEPVLNRTALEYRGLVQSALMAVEETR
ncbi:MULTISPECIES: hypothetical protein [unclassified Streptomyces]|uniref:hypothetical protein n=1 Tax=Streptomyces sp. NPDC127129 TaxID=3345373 RepID=UPI00363D35CD